MNGPAVRRAAGVVAIGTVGGFVLGAAARAWMRLISDDPEFSWSGTIFIVLGFTIFGCTQSIGRLTRESTRRWVPTVGRMVGIVGMLPLFVAAGGIMLPTVVAGGVAAWRPQAPAWLRVLCAAIALVPVVIVSSQITGDFGWSVHSLAGIALLIALYAVIIRLARPTFSPRLDGRRVDRRIVITVTAVAAVLVVGMAVGTG